MVRRLWTTGELLVLRGNRELGARAIAEILDRSESSVRRAAHRDGISLRRPRDKRGRLALDEAVCPDCGRRPIQVAAAGLFVASASQARAPSI